VSVLGICAGMQLLARRDPNGRVERGASDVIVAVDVRPEKLELAERPGSTALVSAAERGAARVRRRSGPRL
jgi:threonine dehydrogenase-like Zn-dependent dehydrogenase